jgi:hypothetical protein
VAIGALGAGELELSVRSRSGTRTSEQIPEAVLDLVLVQTGQKEGKPSASLQWKPPANITKPNIKYCIKISSKLSNEVLKDLEVSGTRLDFPGPGDDYLEPLFTYIFAVQASNQDVRGDWNMIEGSIGVCVHWCAPNESKPSVRIPSGPSLPAWL